MQAFATFVVVFGNVGMNITLDTSKPLGIRLSDPLPEGLMVMEVKARGQAADLGRFSAGR